MTTLALILICCICFVGGALFTLILWLIIDEISINHFVKCLAKEEKEKQIEDLKNESSSNSN